MIIPYDLIKVSHVFYRTQKFIILLTTWIGKHLNKKHCTLLLSVNVIGSSNSRGAGHEEENKFKNLILNPEGNGTCRRPRRRWEENIKKKLDTGCEFVDSNKVTQFRVHWQGNKLSVERQSTFFFYRTMVCRGPSTLTVVLQYLLTCLWVLLVYRQISRHVYGTIRRQNFKMP